jgi:ATP-dependent exoDNAse (exonuclease V) beta subunit
VTRARVGAFLTASAESVDEEGGLEAVSGSLLRLLLSSESASGQLNVQSATAHPSQHDPSLRAGDARSRRYRLSSGAATALPPHSEEIPNQAQVTESSRLPPSLGTSNRLERIIGMVTHRVLELAAADKTPASAQGPAVQTWIEHNLAHYALSPQLTEQAKARISELIEQALTCETGRWILGNQTDAKAELAISRVEAGEVKNYVIDRTFLDVSEGVRWVIDYKTSAPTDGEPVEAFEARECEAYRAQLKNYAELLSGMRWEIDAPIKTALYFPAIQRLSICE